MVDEKKSTPHEPQSISEGMEEKSNNEGEIELEKVELKEEEVEINDSKSMH